MTRSFQDVVNTAGKSLRACLDFICGVEHIKMEAKRKMYFIPKSPTWQEPPDYDRMPLSCRYKAFLRDAKGATAIEYGLIAAGIAVAIIVVVQNVGVKLAAIFTKVGAAL